MNSQKIVNLLTICRKAGKLVTGFDVSIDAIKDGTSKYVLVAVDISPKTLKELNFLLTKNGLDTTIKVLKTSLTMEDIYNCISVKAGIIAICDDGFGKSFEKLTAES